MICVCFFIERPEGRGIEPRESAPPHRDGACRLLKKYYMNCSLMCLVLGPSHCTKLPPNETIYDLSKTNGETTVA